MVIMKNKAICAFSGCAFFLLGSAGAMNLFLNPSFEDGAGAVTFSPSTEFGGAEAFVLTSPSSEITDWSWEQNSGGEAVWLRDNSDFFGSDGDHLLYLDTNEAIQWQDTGGNLNGGETYVFDYNFATWERSQDAAPGDPSSGTGTILLEYNYRDTIGDLQFGSFLVNIRPPANGDSGPGSLVWLTGSENLVIPADYGSDFLFAITTSGTGMLVDNLSLAGIPEPSAIIYVALGSIFVIGRRTRRRMA